MQIATATILMEPRDVLRPRVWAGNEVPFRFEFRDFFTHELVPAEGVEFCVLRPDGVRLWLSDADLEGVGSGVVTGAVVMDLPGVWCVSVSITGPLAAVEDAQVQVVASLARPPAVPDGELLLLPSGQPLLLPDGRPLSF